MFRTSSKTKFLNFIYNTLLCLLFIVMFPWWLYLFWGKGKYRKTWKQRLFPQIYERTTVPGTVIWVHAVSLGETKAVAPLVQRLLQEFPDLPLVMSSCTETGHAEAKKAFPRAHLHLMLPLDFPWLMKPLMATFSPGLVVFVESDFWWNFLQSAKAQGAKLAVVNGKMSESSFRRFQCFSWWSHSLFSLFDMVCVQGEEFLERFRLLGVVENRLYKTGNLKWDQEEAELSAEKKREWADELGIEEGDVVLVVGSTHAGEEKALIEAMLPLLGNHPKVKVILVPRHPERFAEVATLIEKQPVVSMRWSVGKKEGAQLILVDTMGRLNQCYSLAALAFVGGSLYPGVGGHNIMEPCWVGVPVLFGPHMNSQKEMVSLVLEAEAGAMVQLADLPQTLSRWIADAALCKRTGERGKRLKEQLKGSTELTWKTLEATLSLMQKKIQQKKNRTEKK